MSPLITVCGLWRSFSPFGGYLWSEVGVARYHDNNCVPSARHVVMTAGNPSGMAATARATAILK